MFTGQQQCWLDQEVPPGADAPLGVAMQMLSTRTTGRGLNSGVMLADLARMRKTAFSVERDDIMATWGRKGALPWGDQDVLNVYLNGHREQAYVLPCKFNVRCAQLFMARRLCVKAPCVWV